LKEVLTEFVLCIYTAPNFEFHFDLIE